MTTVENVMPAQVFDPRMGRASRMPQMAGFPFPACARTSFAGMTAKTLMSGHGFVKAK
jgi:hypothetical protein